MTRAGRRPRAASAAGGLVAVVGAVLVAAGCGAPAAGAGAPDAGGQVYGSLPSWLPTATAPVGRVLTTSASDPRLGVQGDTMRALLGPAQVLVTAVGPAVPEEGHFPIPETTRCTFTVTMTGVGRTVAVAAAQWTAIDERNVLHRLTLAGRGGAAPPASVTPGATVSFELVGELPPGSGALIWSPAGGRTVGTWDFDVEID